MMIRSQVKRARLVQGTTERRLSSFVKPVNSQFVEIVPLLITMVTVTHL